MPDYQRSQYGCEDTTQSTTLSQTLWAWGRNGWGELGDGTTTARLTPTQESTGATDWTAIDAIGERTMALKSDGTLWGWGTNWNGQLGDGTTTNRNIPTQESTRATDWTAIDAGGQHSVALKSDGTLWAWDDNHYGQLGDGTTTNKSTANKFTPTQIGSATNWSAIATGSEYTVALKSD
jgi:alpha-tubulin suppressor-like RCC1 family protein